MSGTTLEYTFYISVASTCTFQLWIPKDLSYQLVLSMLTPYHYRQILTLPALYFAQSCTKTKINLNFYFHTSLWCLKRFYEDL